MKDPAGKEFLQRARGLLSSQLVGVLGTRFEEAPHQSLVAFVASENLREIFFASPTYTRKVEAMRMDPRVSLLVDNRENQSSDFDATIALTARGNAEPLSAAEAAAVSPRYLHRHPYLREFAASPTCLFFRIRVERYCLVSSFQKVEELSLA